MENGRQGRGRKEWVAGVIGVGERKGKGAIGMDGEGVRGARALGSATRRDTIRARERALSPEVLRRVSPRGIFGYVRVVQELADNELARSAWCRRGSRFRGVSSFLFFFIRRVDTRARSAASEQANERASEEWCVHIVCVCPTISLVRSPTVLPVVPSYVAGPVSTYDRRSRHRRLRRLRHFRHLRHLCRLRRPLEPI